MENSIIRDCLLLVIAFYYNNIFDENNSYLVRSTCTYEDDQLDLTKHVAYVCNKEKGEQQPVLHVDVKLYKISRAFLLYNSFQPHYGHGVYSAPNRNEYQNIFLGVKRCRRIRLTTSLLPSMSQLPRKCGTFDISQPDRDSFTFYFYFLYDYGGKSADF
jgi:hypothetical protein